MPYVSHDLLRLALARNLGKELTPEVAAQIELSSVDREDRSHSPDKFGARIYKGLTFQVERFSEILDELHALHEQHFKETEVHRLGFGLDPNYDYMADMERRGNMIQFTARNEDGKLVGNIRMYVNESLHTRTLYANEDTLYIVPECRQGFTAVRFMQYVEDCLRAIGVREVRTDSKTINKAHRLVEYMGYKHVANKYVKVFTE
jgi:hypothetical protein